jgi:glycyl-tRNA synthetase (class II)
LEDNAVTVRDRDTMEQVRVPIERLMETIDDQLARISARILPS